MEAFGVSSSEISVLHRVLSVLKLIFQSILTHLIRFCYVSSLVLPACLLKLLPSAKRGMCTFGWSQNVDHYHQICNVRSYKLVGRKLRLVEGIRV